MLVARVPTHKELFDALNWDKLDGQARVEKWRSIENLDEQARLDMMPPPARKTEAEAEKKADVETPAAPVELSDDQVDDLIAERLGFPTRFAMRAATSSVKLRAYRDAV